MNRRALLVAPSLLVCAVAGVVAPAGDPAPLHNPAIDMAAHLRLAQEAARHREGRRVTEDEFIRMSSEPGTIVLDARSKEKYDELHVRGAVHVSFPDITVDSLARAIPDKNTRILIYCNNNFSGALGPFPTKVAPASLNLSTYIALYTYGYRNVYELGPLTPIDRSRLTFVSTGGAAVHDRPPAVAGDRAFPQG